MLYIDYKSQTKRNIGVRFKESLRSIKNQEEEKKVSCRGVLT